MNKKNNIYPLVPLRDIVLFPKVIAPLFIGRAKSIKAIEQIDKDQSYIILTTQKDSTQDNPKAKDIFSIGVMAKIIQTLKLPDGTLKVLIEAIKKVKLDKIIENDGFFQTFVTEIEDTILNDIETKALIKSTISLFTEYTKYTQAPNNEVMSIISDIKDPSYISDMIIANISIEIDKKQALLEMSDVKSRLNELLLIIEYEISVLKTEKKIKESVKKQMDRAQKDYFLNEQLKAIHKELGTTTTDGKSEFEQLEDKVKKLRLSKEAKEKATSELNKLKMTNSHSAEATISRTYLDYLLGLPWGKESKLKHDIKEAEEILNREHYGLDKVKERIIEFLAVQKRTKTTQGPILCLVGPPGVGKTSLAKSIADATGREFLKFSLGGIRDEAEIRGHRKTYIGAMPGKIIYLLKKGKTDNPVILLDEIDKIGADYRGDPAAALLEVLDPEQNNKFVDNYLEVEYDISKVLFIATANSTNLHPALLDRLEMIRLSGYMDDEKSQIASKHLLKKQRNLHKLKEEEFDIREDAIKDIILYYTREAGVRSLEREMSKLARKTVVAIEQNHKVSTITPKDLEKMLGVKKYFYGESEKSDFVGVTTGLAYTQVGGDLLSIEAVALPGKGRIKATGKLGEVMQESAQAAFSHFKSTSYKYGVAASMLEKRDIHVHVPEGATPKDGPSAGVTIFTSIVSIMTAIPVKKEVAMTGEITLRGRILPIGGLKEKLLAAHRGKIKTVLIPFENKKDLSEIPKNILEGLKIIPVKTAEEALKYALARKPQPIECLESDSIYTTGTENPNNTVLTH